MTINNHSVPFFSIIVPAYNVERYIESCLESVFRQTEPDFELIVIDDGSDDATGDIVCFHGRKDSRLRYFKTVNAGPSIARNEGISKALGQYLLFLDSDDLLTTDALAVIKSAVEEQDLDMLFYDAEVFYDGVEPSENRTYSRWQSPYVITGQQFFAHSILKDQFYPSPCLYALRAESLQDCRFFPGIYHEDNLFTAQILLGVNIKRVMTLDKALYQRRYRQGSIMTSPKNQRHADGYKVVFEQLVNMYREVSLPVESRSALRTYICQMAYHYLNVQVQLGGINRSFLFCVNRFPWVLISPSVLVSGLLPWLQPQLKSIAKTFMKKDV